MSAARSATPRPGPPPALRLPPVQRHRLAGGLEVLLVERHDLPVVDLQLLVRTGAAADAQRVAGRATLAADLMDEGTAARSALEIADAADFLGADLEPSAGWDATVVALHVLSGRLAPALDLMADLVLRPAFAEAEVARKRDERLAALLQEREEPRALAAHAFAAALYGEDHPFGAPLHGTRQSVAALGRDELEAFHRAYVRPGNAFLVAVGDVAPATLLPLLEEAFGAWEDAPVPAVELPPPPPASPTAIHVVHRPGAAQAEIRVGHVGVARRTPDYFPLLVMNSILGGAFTSRLNRKLREEKGYTYGASSRFDFRAARGPFLAGAAVATSATDDAVADFVAEIRRMAAEPVTPAELERARSYIALGYPRLFETTGSVAARVAEVGLHGLPDDHLESYVGRILAVTAGDVQRVAAAHLDAERLAVVVAADGDEVAPGLERLGLGPVRVSEPA